MMTKNEQPKDSHIFLPEIQQKARTVLDSLIPNDADIILLDYPNTTNVGDSLIWLGEIAYLKSRKLKISYVCDVDNYNLASVKKVLNKKSVVLMHGGGNFGTVWKTIHAFRLKVLSDLPNIPIIQLPQTIYFEDESEVDVMSEAIKAQGNYTLLARSQPSYEFAKKSFATPVYLCPDMAFFIGHIHRQVEKVDRYVLARTDIESSGELDKYTVSINKNLTYEVDDWLEPTLLEKLLYKVEMCSTLLRKWFDPDNQYLLLLWNYLSLQRLKRGVRMLSRGRFVVTDRLHAHVLSILLNKPNVLIDNNYGKLKVFYNTWTFDYGYAKLANNSDSIELAINELTVLPVNENAVK
ncbi:MULTISPECIES: polysaccharide pyruvyl transferase family protein [Methylotenera]|uniref:polysaccharide pyruvyl transferase family protein n=1 Tax=Methylotenera TaxID=359407 RepID=UPI00037B5CFB|nr:MULTISPECIES: polysaccharide pyruvyl transferase family protein [Methylotenera]